MLSIALALRLDTICSIKPPASHTLYLCTLEFVVLATFAISLSCTRRGKGQFLLGRAFTAVTLLSLSRMIPRTVIGPDRFVPNPRVPSRGALNGVTRALHLALHCRKYISWEAPRGNARVTVHGRKKLAPHQWFKITAAPRPAREGSAEVTRRTMNPTSQERVRCVHTFRGLRGRACGHVQFQGVVSE